MIKNMVMFIFCGAFFLIGMGDKAGADVDRDISLPAVGATLGTDLVQAMENVSSLKAFGDRPVPLDAISAILWAGSGMTHDRGDKTVPGPDAVSGATAKNRYTIAWGWGKPYLKTYLLLENGAYEYIPQTHRLEFLTRENLMRKSGSRAPHASGVIVLAADYSMLPTSNEKDRSVAVFSAGSASQNMCVAAAACNVQMLTQMYIKNRVIQKGLKLPRHVEPLVIHSFGSRYAAE